MQKPVPKKAKQELNKLLAVYLTCLDSYFCELYHILQQSKEPNQSTQTELIQRFMRTGRKLRSVLTIIGNHSSNS